MRIIVAGWFSFEGCNVTAGDLMARDVACRWLQDVGHDYDIALAFPFVGGVNWRSVDPNTYSHVVFVCGPFPYMKLSYEFVQHFRGCRLIGLDLSMFEPLDVWNPFDVILERDSPACSRPDISLLSGQAKVPVVGIILVEPQHEYKNKDKYRVANAAVERLIASREMVAVPIDTRLDPNATNLRTAAEVETLISRMDLVVTTRLHGTVLAIKNGVPPIVIDGISGGAKVMRQAKTIGWDVTFSVDSLTDDVLEKAFEYCQTEAARAKARECRDRAIKVVEQVGDEFIKSLATTTSARVWREELIDKSLLESPLLTIRNLAVDQARTLKNKAIHAIGKSLLK
ncbi:MAG: polysaccharide pyruvyl transferase family protein [Desmonostoc vinosum HA7617-LM4]|jgi:hypothetical protein|nr:polysaccharide pyruvyl transferase family protein [Desmonostoc vinosum HA7617-LM4]